MRASGHLRMVGWSAHAANTMLQWIQFRAPGPVRLAAWSAHGVHRRLQSQSCSEHVCCRPSAHARVERSRSSQNAARNLISGAPEVCGKRRHLYMFGLRARAGHRRLLQYHVWISKRWPENASVVNRRHTAAAITSPWQAQARGAGQTQLGERYANMEAEGLLIKRTPKFVEERSMERVRDGAAWREGGWE